VQAVGLKTPVLRGGFAMSDQPGTRWTEGDQRCALPAVSLPVSFALLSAP
jgi:hypothetical protein